MEKAYLITENTNLSSIIDTVDGMDRLYIGDAYCEHNLFYFLDNVSFIENIISLGKPVTLTTPIISDKNIEKLILFIEKYKNLAGLEIVVNDHGLFQYIKTHYSHIRLIWGNFLSGQNKDPYLKIFKDKEIHKRLSIDNEYYKKFFSENNISLVEIYNIFQGLELDQDYNLSLYYPYVVYSINRYCPTKLIYDQKNYLTVVEDCNGCAGKIPPNFHMDLKMKGENSKNFLRGNKQFYENREMIEDRRIQRIIYNYDLVG